jgi:hypothetical protein
MIYLITIAWLAGIVAACLLIYGASERQYWTVDDDQQDLQEQADALSKWRKQ